MSSPFQGPDHVIPELDDGAVQRLFDVADRAINDDRHGIERAVVEPAFDAMQNRVYVVLWQDGRKLASWWAQGENLASTVYSATRKVVESRRPVSGHGLDVHLHILGPDQAWDAEAYRHGLHGVAMRGQRSVSYYPSWAIETNVRPAKLLRKLQSRLERIEPGDATPVDATPGVFFFESRHLARAYGGGDITQYYKGSTPRFDSVMTPQRFERLHAMALDWLSRALADSGEFRYLYYPSRDEFPPGKNNMIRQLMSSRGLAQLAHRDNDWLALHRRNLRFVLTQWYREAGDEGYVWFRNKSKLGANAMLLRTLVHSPLFEQYRAEARRLVNGILSLQQPDGRLQAWYRAPDYVYSEDRLMAFYSGEALLALFEYVEATGDQRVLAAAVRAQEYYLERYVEQIDQHYYPAYVPWHAQSLSALFRLQGDVRYADAVFVMTDRLLEIQQQSAGDRPEHLGRFYNPATPQYGSPHASSDGVYTEGVAYAYELAVLRGDTERSARYRRALLLGLHNLDNLQYRGPRLYFVPRRAAAEGGFRIHSTDNKVRVDSVQHALDAFDKVASLLRSGLLSLDAPAAPQPASAPGRGGR
ncbi:MAG: hypothetical protein V2J89_09845 [Halieaceae bacterium]|nr:hypothetical protein [Halieaceae bacterium]